jgi:hypothetical protein
MRTNDSTLNLEMKKLKEDKNRQINTLLGHKI